MAVRAFTTIGLGLGLAILLRRRRQQRTDRTTVAAANNADKVAARLIQNRLGKNVKGEGFEWKDPTNIYLRASDFKDCVDALLARIGDPSTIDLGEYVDG